MKISGFKDTIAWYNQNADQYAKNISDDVVFDQIEDFSALLPADGSVLDAGCAAGRDSSVLLKKGFKVTGLDLSSALLRVAKTNNPDIRFIEGDFRSLPFDDEIFDGIWSHASLLHLDTVLDVKRALAEFNRTLKTGGVLHVLVKAQTNSQKTAVVNDKLSGHDRFFQYFTEDELIELLKESGFGLVHREQYRETDKFPNGRPEVEWLLSLSMKTSKRL